MSVWEYQDKLVDRTDLAHLLTLEYKIACCTSDFIFGSGAGNDFLTGVYDLYRE